MAHPRVDCSVLIAAPPPVIFEAITIGEKLATWWPRAAETEPRPGGKVILFWKKTDLSNRAESTFKVYKPPYEVSYWGATFTLSDVNGKTKVRIVDDEVPAEGLASVAQAWGALRLNLKTVLEFGIDLRPGFYDPWE